MNIFLFTTTSFPTWRCTQARRFPLLYPAGLFSSAYAASEPDTIDASVFRCHRRTFTFSSRVPRRASLGIGFLLLLGLSRPVGTVEGRQVVYGLYLIRSPESWRRGATRWESHFSLTGLERPAYIHTRSAAEQV